MTMTRTMWELVQFAGWVTARQIADTLNIPVNQVSAFCSRLCRLGVLERQATPYRYQYRSVPGKQLAKPGRRRKRSIGKCKKPSHPFSMLVFDAFCKANAIERRKWKPRVYSMKRSAVKMREWRRRRSQ